MMSNINYNNLVLSKNSFINESFTNKDINLSIVYEWQKSNYNCFFDNVLISSKPSVKEAIEETLIVLKRTLLNLLDKGSSIKELINQYELYKVSCDNKLIINLIDKELFKLTSRRNLIQDQINKINKLSELSETKGDN